MKNDLTLIRITKESSGVIKHIANERGLKHITVLEYLLHGKIELKEFNDLYKKLEKLLTKEKICNNQKTTSKT